MFLNAARTVLSPRAMRHLPRKLSLINTRQFVDHAVFSVLCKSNLGRIAVGKLAIQVPGQCEANSRRMHQDLSRALVAEDVLLKPCQAFAEARSHRHWLLDLLLGDEDADHGAWSKQEPTFDNIVTLNRKHGPVMLRMRAMLRPGQGAEEYENYHCALLLGTFKRGDQTIGLLLDGNDMQENPAMSAIRDYMSLYGDTRDLFELTPSDLEAITKESRARTGQDLDVRQLGLRLVDLQELVAASEQKMKRVLTISPDSPVALPLPNAVLCDEQATVAEPLLPHEVCDELIALIAEDPSRVERF